MAIHVNCRLWDSSSLMPDIATARRVASILLSIGAAYGRVLFAVVGDHIHVVLLCDRRRAGVFARAAEAAITMVFAHRPGFRPAHFAPVFSEGHLEELVDYVLGQHAKHGVTGDLLLESTNLLDLLMVRLVETSSAQLLAEAVPTLDRSALLEHVGGDLSPGTDPGRLVEAASVVSGGLAFGSQVPVATRVRRATIRTSLSLGVGLAQTSALLGVGYSTAKAMRRESDPLADRAVSLALGLVQRRAPAGFPTRIELAERRWTPGGRTRIA